MSKKRKTRAEKIKSAKRLEKQREQWLKIQNVQDEYKMHLEELAKREKNNKKSRDIQMGGAFTLILALVAFLENTLDSPKDYNDLI